MSAGRVFPAWHGPVSPECAQEVARVVEFYEARPALPDELRESLRQEAKIHASICADYVLKGFADDWTQDLARDHALMSAAFEIEVAWLLAGSR